jgi:hypothetical protein
MFEGIKNAGALFAVIARIPVRYPVMLAPLLLVWCIYAPVTVYLYFQFPWNETPLPAALALTFGVLFLFSYSISLAAFVLLEQIRIVENGQEPGLLWPLRAAFWNSVRALHITLIWAFLWFILTIAEAALRPKQEGLENEPSAENVARLLAGVNSNSSIGALFDALKKGVRMIAFLIYPAVAWERHAEPIRRGLAVGRAHRTEFAAGFVITGLAAGVVFIPPVIVFILADQTEVPFPDWIWFAVIIYSGLAWSFTMLLEQLFAAELYLWDMKWRRACDAAESAGEPAPPLSAVPRPSILDGKADLQPG